MLFIMQKRVYCKLKLDANVMLAADCSFLSTLNSHLFWLKENWHSNIETSIMRGNFLRMHQFLKARINNLMLRLC